MAGRRAAGPILAALLLAAAAGSLAASAGEGAPALPLVLSTGWRVADGDPPDGVAGIDRLDFRPADPVTDQAARLGV